MNRSAPLSPQLATFLSTAAGTGKAPAANRGKSDSSSISKRPTQFSSLLGHLVEKKEKSADKPSSPTASVPFASALSGAMPEPQKPKLGAFGLGNSGGDPLPAPASALQPTLAAPVLSLPVQAISGNQSENRAVSVYTGSRQTAVSAQNDFHTGSQPALSKPTPSPDLLDSDDEIHTSPTLEEEEIRLPHNPVELAGTGPGLMPSAQIVSDALLTSLQLAASSGQRQAPAQTSATEFQPELTEKEGSPKAKATDSGLRERIALANNSGWESQILSKTQSAATESGSGGSEYGRDANEKPAQSQQSEGANRPQSNAGEGNLAFAARLVPQRLAEAANHDTPTPPPQTTRAEQAVNAAHSSGGAKPEISKESTSSNQPAEGPPAAPSPSPASQLMAAMPQTTPGQLQNNVPSEVSPGQDSSPQPALKETQAATPAPGQQTGAAPPARDIHLQLNQGEQRVDIRLSERSGEVHVAVRTPDPQLAGALRDDLPHLSDRLEQSGFHAETWHGAFVGTNTGGERRLEARESSFSNPQESGHGQAEQENQQQQQQQQRQPKPGAPQNSNSQRKDFQWLMSQLP